MLTGSSIAAVHECSYMVEQLAWIASAGHCANIFASGSTHLGTGATGRYWVQVRLLHTHLALEA
jgi:hypothetical protein